MTMSLSADVSEVSLALVRDFLKRNGLNETLSILEKESPRESHSIGSKSQLLKSIRLEKEYVKNRETNSSYSSILEIFVQTRLERIASTKDNGLKIRPGTAPVKPETKQMASQQSNRSNSRPPSRQDHRPESAVGSRFNLGPSSLNNSRSKKNIVNDVPSSGPVSIGKVTSEQRHHKITSSSSLILEDITDNFDNGFDISVEQQQIAPTRDLTFEELEELGSLMFGPGQGRVFPESWRQGFYFSKEVSYGLKQRDGGPCGVIAPVQAYLFKEMLKFGKPFDSIDTTKLLQFALSSILEKIAKNGMVSVVLPKAGDNAFFNLPCSNWNVFEIPSLQLQTVMRNFMPIFMRKKGVGIIAFCLSAILTRGLDRIIADFDHPQNSLMGRFAQCNQELVNLLLTGRATTNCFDGVQSFDEMELTGIVEKPEIGLISIYEVLNHLIVGDNYKFPSFPVWIIFNENHYATLCTTQLAKYESCDDLEFVYWDQLAKQREEIILILKKNRFAPTRSENDSMLIRILETISIFKGDYHWKNESVL
eukprot:TRINITY_DN6961_c0_g1_i1.p1 TRINITY_DN6961_c0_g1~~TRINITY_DN6961_c0_g1_i1.p1  ORF type:complete len:535 (-),score=148.18 TRINITY_DN6961_c0_g1_i1:26-1630(-)